jgi:signal transduction histidine kinase
MSDESDGELNRLVDAIAQKAVAIENRWRSAAVSQIGEAALAASGLQHLIRQALEDIRARLPSTGAGVADRAVAGHHDQLKSGYDIGVLIQEYDLLRISVIEEWQAAIGGDMLPSSPCMLLHRIFDGFILQAVTRKESDDAHAATWQARESLEARTRQQSELSAFGLRALQTLNLQTVLEDAVATVTRTLRTELTKVLEISHAGDSMVLRAGVGWADGLVGHATVPAGSASQAGFTLETRQPVIVEDLQSETRFHGPALLLDHGAVSGVSAIIEAPGREGRSYGVLGTHTRTRRTFGSEDAAFVQSIANIIGAAILRARSERRAAFEQRRGDTQQLLAEACAALASTVDYEETLTQLLNQCVRSLADCCIIDLADDGELREIRVVHRDPDKRAIAGKLQALRLAENRHHLGYPVLQEQQPLLLPAVSADYLQSVAQSEQHLQLLRELNPASLMALPLTAHGRPVGALVLLSCNESRRYDPDDLELADELARRAALAIDGARSHAQAQRAIRTRDTVLGIVAHDLRTPIHVIQLAARSLAGSEPEIAAAREQAVERIRRASQRANRLIQDLLDVGSIEAGKLSLDRSPTRPESVVADVAELFAPALEEAGLLLENAVPSTLPDLSADADRLIQVLSNLLDNAIAATATGGRIRIEACEADDSVCFRVSDSGRGIAAEQLPHLFDRYWRVDRDGRKGTGLGLSIAKGIVDSHGGAISVQSIPGEGSTFAFTIPVVSAAPA